MTTPKTPKLDLPKSAKYVTVASAVPMNLELQLCRETTASVTGQFGSVKETVMVKTGPIHVIRGNAYPAGTVPKGFPKAPVMIDDTPYALTPKVDAEFFAEWLKQNAETDLVRNKLIRAHHSLDHLEGEALETKKVRSGLEPVDPEGDSRAPKPLNSLVQPIVTEERAAAA